MREDLRSVAGSLPCQTNDTIERKKTTGSEQNSTSVCVSDQPRRIVRPASHERFMSQLLQIKGSHPGRAAPPLVTMSISTSPIRGLERFAPGDLAEINHMHTPCRILEASEKRAKKIPKSFAGKCLRNIWPSCWSTRRSRWVERSAPEHRSLATTSGANRSTSTPHWWRFLGRP